MGCAAGNGGETGLIVICVIDWGPAKLEGSQVLIAG